MPIAAMMLDPMLNPFRGMLQDVEGRGLSGPDVDEMRAQLALMERLGQEMSDLAAYNGKLAQQQAFQRFSDAYSRALSQAAKPASGGDAGAMPSDEQMLDNTVSAYASSLASYQRGEAGEEAKALIPVLERIVGLGRSGISFPVFLRALEEEGLSRALDGAAPAARAGFEQDLAFAQQSWLPRKVEERTEILRRFDELVARAPFGQPDPVELALARSHVEWDYAPLHRRWQAEVSRWQQLLDLLVDWLDAHTSFAPFDQRWRPPGASDADVARNIARTKACAPGELRLREAIYQEYFHADWEGIWQSETFGVEYSANRVEWSDERLQLIRETRPHCLAATAAPEALISRAEALHPGGDYRPERGTSPPWGTPLRWFS